MVKASLPDARILLFGSQVNGKADSHSDYDLLIITPGPFTQKEKFSRSSILLKAIIKAIWRHESAIHRPGNRDSRQ